MALTLVDIKNLISVVQAEDDIASAMARTDILVEITDNHMDRHLSKYIKKNTVGGMDGDDMRQIFLIACSVAIDEANINTGNPLLFILQKGKWAVVDELRKTYRRDLRQWCRACKTETRIHERGHMIECPKCGAKGPDNVERIQVNITDDGSLTVGVKDDRLNISESSDSQMIVDEFRSRLTGRKADVYDLIMIEGIDRDSSKNYLRDVADKLGVTPANVNLRLRQIKEEWKIYMEEKDLEEYGASK